MIHVSSFVIPEWRDSGLTGGNTGDQTCDHCSRQARCRRPRREVCPAFQYAPAEVKGQRAPKPKPDELAASAAYLAALPDGAEIDSETAMRLMHMSSSSLYKWTHGGGIRITRKGGTGMGAKNYLLASDVGQWVEAKMEARSDGRRMTLQDFGEWKENHGRES